MIGERGGLETEEEVRIRDRGGEREKQIGRQRGIEKERDREGEG